METTDMADMMTSFMTSAPPTSHDVTTNDDYGDYGGEDFFCDVTSVREFRARLQPPLYWSIVLVGGLGNLAVVWIYLHFRQRLKTMTDVMILNLAVADLLFLVSLPLWAVEASQGWGFGVGLCKVNSALYKINLFSSMLLLTCIAVDRYIAIVQTTRAHNSKQQRLRCSKLVCAVVWTLAVLLATPEFLFAKPSDSDDGKQYCRLVFPADMGNKTKIAVLSLQVSVGFCLPFCIMLFCYSVIVGTLLKTRNFEKHKAMRVVLAVVVVFVLTQLPHNCALVTEAVQATRLTIDNCAESKRFLVAGQLLMSLAYTHACLNPFLYAFVGVRFRRDVLRLLREYRCLPKTAGLGIKSSSQPPPLSLSRLMSVTSDDTSNTALSL